MAACVLFASNGDIGASRFKRGLVNLADFLPLRNRRLRPIVTNGSWGGYPAPRNTRFRQRLGNRTPGGVCLSRSLRRRRRRDLHLLGARALAPTLSATAEFASEAPRIRPSPASTSPCRRGKSFVPAPSLRPRPATTRKAIKSSGPILATSLSSGTAKPPLPTADGFDDLCRCSDRRGSGSGHKAQWQVPTINSVGNKPEMTAVGRVSRGSPVQTAIRNCTRDEGRSFEAGSQVPASNRCKLLSSKAMVVSVAVNVGKISRRVVKRGSASEPLMPCRKRIRRCQNREVPLPPGSAWKVSYLLPCSVPCRVFVVSCSSRIGSLGAE